MQELFSPKNPDVKVHGPKPRHSASSQRLKSPAPQVPHWLPQVLAPEDTALETPALDTLLRVTVLLPEDAVTNTLRCDDALLLLDD